MTTVEPVMALTSVPSDKPITSDTTITSDSSVPSDKPLLITTSIPSETIPSNTDPTGIDGVISAVSVEALIEARKRQLQQKANIQPGEFLEVAKTIKLLPIVNACYYDPNNLQTGIIYWLASNMGRSKWNNPMNGNKPILKVEPKNVMHIFSYGSPVVYPTELRVTPGQTTSSLTLTFLRHRVMIFDFVIRNGNSRSTLNFKLEGESTSGLSAWTPLYESGKQGVSNALEGKLYHIKQGHAFHSMFKFTFMSNINISGVEFFGVVMTSDSNGE